MKIIKIGFSKHKGFAPVSWAIMACEHTPFSHVFIEFYSERLDRHLIYHATGSGVYFWGKDEFLKHNEIVKIKEIQVKDDSYTRLQQWCVDQSGKAYSHLQICLIGIKRLFRLFNIQVPNFIVNRSDDYICSELVEKALEEIGMSQMDDADRDFIGLRSIEMIVDSIKSTL